MRLVEGFMSPKNYFRINSFLLIRHTFNNFSFNYIKIEWILRLIIIYKNEFI